MRAMTVMTVLAGLAFAGPVRADVDLSALAIHFRVVEGALTVQAEYGVWHDAAQADYTVEVTLTQLRDGVPVATVWRTTHGGLSSSRASSAQPGCRVQSCTGACDVGGRNGESATMTESCDGKDGYRECLCALKSASVTLQAVEDGDVFRLTVTPIGATDLDPSNNVLTVAFN